MHHHAGTLFVDVPLLLSSEAAACTSMRARYSWTRGTIHAGAET